MMNAAPNITVASEQPERADEARLDRSSGVAAPNAVATAFPAATDAAIEMLRRGGNAVDAAAAAAWALSVCEPSGSGLGGQAALLIHFPSG
ncbi:MAG: gamma-glutamyltransferase, partial [Candidatus Eisenbacteria bacterium]